MNHEQVVQFLTSVAISIVLIAEIAHVPLILARILRDGSLEGLNTQSAPEHLFDLCIDSFMESIHTEVEKLIQLTYQNLPLPPAQQIQDAVISLHQDSESIESLLTILKILTELGPQRGEFLEIVLYISQLL